MSKLLATLWVAGEVLFVGMIVQYKLCDVFFVFVVRGQFRCVDQLQVTDRTINLIPFAVKVSYCYQGLVGAGVKKRDLIFRLCSVDCHLKYCSIFLFLRLPTI